MTQFIFGNWKMYGNGVEAQALASSLTTIAIPPQAKVAVFPPFTSLASAAASLKGSTVALGAQDCSPYGEGAYTGDVSAKMLKDAGCDYVILGHSERRQYHQEQDETVKNKAGAAMEAGLVPVICVGESEAERKAGRHLDAVAAQIRGSLPELNHSDRFIIAYEPVWAIGSGSIPTAEQIGEMHKTIASLLTYATSGARTAIIYGGSVKAVNAAGIFNTDMVNGVLVGGASLKPEEFGAIIAAAGS